MHSPRLLRLILVTLLIVCISACNFRPQVIKELFSTSTPTFTVTPPPTATPTPTATATPTPLPAVNLTPCAFARYCPGVANITDFIGGDANSGQVYHVEIPYNVPVGFHTGWTAKDEATLAENLKHLRFILEIDGNDYYDERFTAQDLAYFPDDPYTGYPSVFTGITTDGWKVGEPHTVEIGFEFDADVFDGWDTYPGGTRYTYFYDVNPVLELLATATPNIQPTAVSTPRPTRVPPTAAPACDRSGTISIKNDTGASVTIYMKGPANFTFFVAAGNQTLSICPGTYSYTGYGCGGVSRTGEVNDGEEIEFACDN